MNTIKPIDGKQQNTRIRPNKIQPPKLGIDSHKKLSKKFEPMQVLTTNPTQKNIQNQNQAIFTTRQYQQKLIRNNQENENDFELQGIDINPVRMIKLPVKKQLKDQQNKKQDKQYKNRHKQQQQQNNSISLQSDRNSNCSNSIQQQKNNYHNEYSQSRSSRSYRSGQKPSTSIIHPVSKNSLEEYNKNDYEVADYTVQRNLTYSTFLRDQIKKKSQKTQRRKQKGTFSQQNSVKMSESTRQDVTCINNIFSDEFFAGRLSVVWLFIIKSIESDLMTQLQKIYSSITQRDYQIPLCRNVTEALQFFSSQSSYFKVVVDLDNAEELISHKELQNKILSIYIFNGNPSSQNSLFKSIKIKSSSKKVRGSYIDLSALLKRAQLDITNGNKFSKQKEGTIHQIKFQSKLPTFIKLTGQDKSQVTTYRMNLYGAIKLQNQRQRGQKCKQFQQLVRRVYHKSPDELDNLLEYLQIDHVTPGRDNQKKHFSVLRFYVQQTFYYSITNNMLRICRTVEEFRPLTIPFNQNYNAIKFFYNKIISENEGSVPAYQLYRGASIKEKDFQNLRQGDFVQLLGFVSTSKNQSYTKENFIRKKGDFLFVFNIKQRNVDSKLRQFDHGFVDLSHYNIATTQFQAQQEVLLNALNVYKVQKILSEEDSEDGIGRVYLEYGAIFQLYEKKQDDLTQSQKSVLANYRYCIKQMNQIQDLGDVLMKAQQYDKCKEFYHQKIKIQPKIQYYNKLAEAHYKCGQTVQARQNAIKSLQKYEKDIQIYKTLDKQKCMKIVQIHEKNVKFLLQKQDSLNAKKAINFEIDLLEKQNEWIIKSEKLRQRGEINLKQGNLIQSQNDLKQSQKIILQKINSFSLKRKQIQNKHFYKKLFKCLCFSGGKTIQQKKKQLQAVDNAQKQTLKMNQQIHELLLKINESLVNVAEFIGDKKGYQQCVKKGKQYFSEFDTKRAQNGFEKAKVKVIQAKVQNAVQKKENVQKSYELMEQAIELIQQIQPMNQKIGQYNRVLGLFKKKQCSKSFYLPPLNIPPHRLKKSQLFKSKSKVIRVSQPRENQVQIGQEQQVKFDQQTHQRNYQQVKQNFNKALVVIAYHKTQDHPEIFELRNHLAELEYDFSRLNQGQVQANMVLNTEKGPLHSQGAKSSLLLAKIFLAQGEVKSAFQSIQRSHLILRVALLKQENNPIYMQLLVSSPTYMQIQLFRCKIYNRQLNHDLSLKSLRGLKDIAKRKLKDADGVGYLADIYEQLGNTLVYGGDTIQFQKNYLKAMKLRENEMGKYNIMNAICLCTMAKYLLFTMDADSASGYLQESFNIFSHFPHDHPNFWIQLSTMAYLSEKLQNPKNQFQQVRQSIKLIQKRYSKTHINYLKMKLRYASVLFKNSKYQQAMSIYEKLQRQMQTDISLSRKTVNNFQVQQQETIKDNQKIGIREQVEQKLRQTQVFITNSKGNQMDLFGTGDKTKDKIKRVPKIKMQQNLEYAQVKKNKKPRVSFEIKHDQHPNQDDSPIKLNEFNQSKKNLWERE